MISEKKLNTEYNFLFNTFSNQDIEAIIQDLQLFSQNYYFLYVVDTYDIVENYLPYTEMELFSRRNRNHQAQKFICYDYFFGRLNTTSTILLNEYKIELLAAKNKLAKHLGEAKSVLKNLETLKKDTNDFVSDPKKTEDFFKNHFEVILLLLILNDKTNSILGEFFSFLRTRLLVSEVKSKNEEDSEKLNRIFESCKHSKLAINIFENYIENNKSQLVSISSNTDRHIFLENTFRDSQVIDRIIQINRLLEKDGLKYYVIYLSTANKTIELFKSLNQINAQSQITKPSRHLFHRNIYQYFLYDKIKNEYPGDINRGIDVLRVIQSLITKTSEGSQLNEILQSITDEKFLRIIKHLSIEKSNVIDNHFYLSVYERYKETFQKIENEEKEKPFNRREILKIVQEIEKKREKYNLNMFNLDFTLSQLNQTYEIVDTFHNIGDYELEYKYGKDIIRNPYQHLPYLLLIDESFNTKLKTKLYAFLNSAIEVNSKKKEELKVNLRALVDELSTMSIDDGYHRLMRSLILTYINFVGQPKDRKVINKGANGKYIYDESELLLDFEKQYDIIKYQFAKIDADSIKPGEKLQFKHDDPPLMNEIIYVLIWLYRRSGEYEDVGIERGMELIQKGFDDPRIYQGIGLCHIARTYKLIKKNENLSGMEVQKHLDLALHFLRLSKDKYKLFININDKTDTTHLVLKNYIAVLNSIADVSLRKYEIEISRKHQDITLLEIARSMINEIKELFDVLGLLYDKYPTYSATEMEIEYFEAECLFQNGLRSKAHQKILNALSRAGILKKLLEEKSFVDEIFLKKESMINKLNAKILSEF